MNFVIAETDAIDNHFSTQAADLDEILQRRLVVGVAKGVVVRR